MKPTMKFMECNEAKHPYAAICQIPKTNTVICYYCPTEETAVTEAILQKIMLGSKKAMVGLPNGTVLEI